MDPDNSQLTEASGKTNDTRASRLHASAPVRWLLWIAGSIALLLGILGIFLPVLPATPFILLAAACYARASERFHQRLLAHPSFGPVIRDWEEYGAVSMKTKKVAITMMTLSIAVSIWVVREMPWLQVMLAIIAVTVGTWLWRRPTKEATPISDPSSSADASP